MNRQALALSVLVVAASCGARADLGESSDTSASKPMACATGTDPQTNSPYVICKVTPAVLWISADTIGTYHALEICSLYGYGSLGRFGGTCGSVCGFCEGDGKTSCSRPGREDFDGNGLQGRDNFGQELGNSVMWECLP
jgi:hypothetical protein